MINEKIVDPNRSNRRVTYVLGLLVLLPGILFLLRGEAWKMLVLILTSLMITWVGSVSYPYAVLSEEGIAVRFFLWERFFSWDQILQTGRYRTEYRKQPHPLYFSLVLVLPQGSPKKPGRDKFFLRRNYCKAVSLPNDRKIRLFLEKYYGPLSFDDYQNLSDWERRGNKLDER